MILYLPYSGDDQARNLAVDLQNCGAVLALNGAGVADACIVPLTPAAIRAVNWAALGQDTRPVVPVMLAKCDVPKQLRQPPIDLSIDYPSGFRQLMLRLRAIVAEKPGNPYIGLRAYGEFDASRFYGRTEMVAHLKERLSQGNRLVVLSGPAGSGRTSVINAGLVAALRESDNHWLPLYVGSGDAPWRLLATRLNAAGIPSKDEVGRLQSDPAVLERLLSSTASSGARPLVILDSFDRLFERLDMSGQVFLLDSLRQAISAGDGAFAFVMSIESTFEERLGEFPQWLELLSANRVVLPVADESFLREVIENPAKDAGLKIEKPLVTRLLQDASDLDAGRVLPALSLTLSRLTDMGKMNVSAYREVGLLDEAVSRHADGAFQKVSPLQQRIARAMLLQMVRPDSNNRLVPARVPISQFVYDWADADLVRETIGQFTVAGIWTPSLGAEDGAAHLELTHVGLTEQWPRYAGWIADESEVLHYRAGLERKAEGWKTRQSPASLLLRGTALDEAMNWSRETESLPSATLKAFLTASASQRQSIERHESRRTIARLSVFRALAILLVLATGIIGLGGLVTARTVSDKNVVETLQANTARDLATSTAQSAALAAMLEVVDARVAGQQHEISTLTADLQVAATAQAQASTAMTQIQATAAAGQISAVATITALESQVGALVTTNASMAQMQSTLDALSASQIRLQRVLADRLARDARDMLTDEPVLALRLAAESAWIKKSIDPESPDAAVEAVLRDALKANAITYLGDEVRQSWFLDTGNLVALDYETQPDVIWQTNPPRIAVTLPAPIAQLIPVAGGRMFLLDFEDETPDVLWSIETLKEVAQLSGELASQPVDPTISQQPGVVQFGNGSHFVVRYDDNHLSELWETTTPARVAALDGDVTVVTPLKDGYFFVDYAEESAPGGVWDMSTGSLVEPADALQTKVYDNGIFALRHRGRLDEIWVTSPFSKLAQVIGRVETVTNLQGTNYFVIQYAGDKPAEIWEKEPSAQLAYAFPGQIDISITYQKGRFFFVRYADKSPSQLWSSDPLEPVATLNGHLNRMDIFDVQGGEQVILNYKDNPLSELWSLPDHKRLAVLSGNMDDVVSIMGDTFFVIRYSSGQPPELWSAVDEKRLTRLGQPGQVTNVIQSLKGGNAVVLLKEAAPAEVWGIQQTGATRLAQMPAPGVNVYPFEGNDYFIVNLLDQPAEIWRTADATRVVTLESDIRAMAYRPDTQTLSYWSSDGRAFALDFGGLVQLTDDTESALTETDLLSLACARIGANPSAVDPTTLRVYLGELQPIACTESLE